VAELRTDNVVLDAVLMPPPRVAERSIQASRALAECGTEFVLDDTTLFGHVSLYMGAFEPAAVPAAVTAVTRVAAEVAPLPLVAEGYAADPEQGMVEVAYRKSTGIVRLQDLLIAALNPIRSGLRECDPVGRLIASWLPTTAGEIRANLDAYGYDEIGGFFRPHITFTRFLDRSAPLDSTLLPDLLEFSGVFDRLGLYEMGPHGTCTRAVVDLPLTGSG
jgi:hypothetical protein